MPSLFSSNSRRRNAQTALLFFSLTCRRRSATELTSSTRESGAPSAQRMRNISGDVFLLLLSVFFFDVQCCRPLARSTSRKKVSSFSHTCFFDLPFFFFLASSLRLPFCFDASLLPDDDDERRKPGVARRRGQAGCCWRCWRCCCCCSSSPKASDLGRCRRSFLHLSLSLCLGLLLLLKAHPPPLPRCGRRAARGRAPLAHLFFPPAQGLRSRRGEAGGRGRRRGSPEGSQGRQTSSGSGEVRRGGDEGRRGGGASPQGS